MHVSPIINNGRQIPNRQTFKARIPKQFVKQMEGKTEPLEHLKVESSTNLEFTIPAAIAAKTFINKTDKVLDETELASMGYSVKKLPGDKELKISDAKELIRIAQLQDIDGQTIFHKRYTPEILDTFLSYASNEEFAKVFSKLDNKNKTAYMINPELKDAIQKAATSGEIPLDDSIKLLEVNGINDTLTQFLKYRTDKENATSKINNRLYNELKFRSDNEVASKSAINDRIDVETYSAEYKNLPLQAAARLFVSEHAFSSLATLDTEYLPKAPKDDLRALMKSALQDSESNDCITDICRKIENNHKLLEPIIDAIQGFAPNPEFLEIFTSLIQEPKAYRLYAKMDTQSFVPFAAFTTLQPEVYRLYAKMDTQGMRLMDHIANHCSPEQIQKHLMIMDDNLEPKNIYEILLSKDYDENITATKEPVALAILKHYGKNNPTLIKDTFENQDNAEQQTILHKSSNPELASELFEALQDNPLALAGILSIKDSSRQTAYQKAKALANNNIGYQKYAEILRNNIIELATNSDLSIKESIDLLNINNLEPQIQEYLKLQENLENTAT